MWGQIFLFVPDFLSVLFLKRGQMDKFCPRGNKGKGTNKKWGQNRPKPYSIRLSGLFDLSPDFIILSPRGQNHSKPYAAWLYVLYPAFKRGDSDIIPAIIEKTLRHSCAYAQDWTWGHCPHTPSYLWISFIGIHKIYHHAYGPCAYSNGGPHGKRSGRSSHKAWCSQQSKG